MINKLKLAKELSKLAHSGQFDKSGKPYYLHPETVASFCRHRNEKIVAYLHDTVEDTYVTLDLLKLLGFSNKVITAVSLLTHDKSSVTYHEYLDNIKANKLAKTVKLADLTHNSDIGRFEAPTEKQINKCKKYKKRYDYLIGKVVDIEDIDNEKNDNKYYEFLGYYIKNENDKHTVYLNGEVIEDDHDVLLNFSDAMHDYGDFSISDVDEITKEEFEKGVKGIK